MPKGDKRKKNNPAEAVARGLEMKDDNSEYAFIAKATGGGIFTARMNISGEMVRAILPGKLTYGKQKKKNFVSEGTVVLVSFREFEAPKEKKLRNVDVIYVYTADEVRQLKKAGELFEATDEQDGDETAPSAVTVDDTGFDFGGI